MADKLLPDLKSTEKVVISPKNELIWEDIKRALYNSAKFAAPLLLVMLFALQAGTPWKDALLLVYGAALQLAIDLLTKFIAKDKYIVEK